MGSAKTLLSAFRFFGAAGPLWQPDGLQFYGGFLPGPGHAAINNAAPGRRGSACVHVRRVHARREDAWVMRAEGLESCLTAPRARACLI